MLDHVALARACQAQGLTHDEWFGGLVELRAQGLVQMRDYDGGVALLQLTTAGLWAHLTRSRADLADVTERLLDVLDGAEPNVALALGADLGGNATAVGASANVVVLGMAERAGRRITFWEFTKYGLVVTAVTIALCVPYLWLRYFALA